MRLPLSLAAALIWSAAHAQPASRSPGRDLREAQRAQAALAVAQQDAASRATAAVDAERALTDQRIAATGRLQRTEVEAAAIAAEVDALASRQRAAADALALHEAALEPVLPLIERLALYPSETLLALPAPAPRALQGLAVLRGLTRQLESEAAALRAEQDEVAASARALEAAAVRLGTTQATQAGLAAALDHELGLARSRRVLAEDAGADAARRAAVEAARADGLRAALAAMEAERAQAEVRARADMIRADRQRESVALLDAKRRQDSLNRPAGPGLLGTDSGLVPVAGSVARAWGDRTEAGPASGITYATPPGARVVAPCTGRIAFAGPFRSYGIMLIQDCGRGYHFVLAGFERLDVAVGEPARAGEPVGLMPGWYPGLPGSRPVLYIELRREGQAINPAPFLRVRG